jgi:hypothetical protein
MFVTVVLNRGHSWLAGREMSLGWLLEMQRDTQGLWSLERVTYVDPSSHWLAGHICAQAPGHNLSSSKGEIRALLRSMCNLLSPQDFVLRTRAVQELSWVLEVK